MGNDLPVAVVVRDSDHFGHVLEIEESGAWRRRPGEPTDRCSGFGQVRPDGSVSAVYATTGVVLRHASKLWDLGGLRVEVGQLGRAHRVARLLDDAGCTIDTIEYDLDEGHAWQRQVDPTWDGMDEESNDLFVFLAVTNTPTWRANVFRRWREGLSFK